VKDRKVTSNGNKQNSKDAVSKNNNRERAKGKNTREEKRIKNRDNKYNRSCDKVKKSIGKHKRRQE